MTMTPTKIARKIARPTRGSVKAKCYAPGRAMLPHKNMDQHETDTVKTEHAQDENKQPVGRRPLPDLRLVALRPRKSPRKSPAKRPVNRRTTRCGFHGFSDSIPHSIYSRRAGAHHKSLRSGAPVCPKRIGRAQQSELNWASAAGNSYRWSSPLDLFYPGKGVTVDRVHKPSPERNLHAKNFSRTVFSGYT